MPKFEIQVGRDARVYYKTTIEAESLEEAMAMNSRHGFNAPSGCDWVEDGIDEMDNVETVSVTDPSTDRVIANYVDGDGWMET